jgi:hypothetical protein
LVEVVYETHSTSVDNERGIATGWLDGALSARELARALGERRRDDGIAAVYASISAGAHSANRSTTSCTARRSRSSSTRPSRGRKAGSTG